MTIIYGINVLRIHYEARPDVYVSGDLLIYYEEGNPRVSVAPDVFVVFGVEDRMRMNYLVWEEGKAPDFVLEVASENTWREDLGPKRDIYACLGVKEYWIYDPTGEYLSPVLRGLRLVEGRYVPQPAVASSDGVLTLHSETLGLELRAKDGEMRFRDPATDKVYLSHSELAAALREETDLREEADARRAAELRIAELEALLGKTSA